MQLWACGREAGSDPLHGGKGNQAWKMVAVAGGHQLLNPTTGRCLTAVHAAGWAVGLDAGVNVVAAQLLDCYPAGTANQVSCCERKRG